MCHQNAPLLVSVIVPIRNASEYVGRCVKNLNDQTYQNIEIILVVDPDLDDGTIEAVNKASKDNNHLKTVMRPENVGVGYARNLGIDNASGDIIWFLDVDDYAYPTFLEEMVNILETKDADAVFCNFFQERKMIIPPIPDVNYSVKTYENHSALENFDSLPTYPWAHIQRKQVLRSKETYFFDTGTSEDLDQIIRELAIAHKVCYYDKPLYVYYKHKNNSTKTNRQKDADAIETVALRTLAFVKEKCPEQYERFRFKMIERFMRQIAFVKYKTYSRVYRDTPMIDIIDSIPEKTREMSVFLKSKLLYYVILFPFTHWIWDNKTGLWDDRDSRS